VNLVVVEVALEDMHIGAAAVGRLEEVEVGSESQLVVSCLALHGSFPYSATDLDAESANVGDHFSLREKSCKSHRMGGKGTHAGTSRVGSGQATSQWPFWPQL
jgi:hypothetical protein